MVKVFGIVLISGFWLCRGMFLLNCRLNGVGISGKGGRLISEGLCDVRLGVWKNGWKEFRCVILISEVFVMLGILVFNEGFMLRSMVL